MTAERWTTLRCAVYPVPIAHNVLPLQFTIVDDGSLETDEEQKYRNESRKILGIPDLAVTCTCVRVPVFTGHSAAIVAEFERELSVERATEVLMAAPAWSSPRSPPRSWRRDATSPSWDASVAPKAPRNALAFFVVGDNLRKGAALNVVQIAEALVAARVR